MSLAYCCHGDINAPPLLLLHGFLGSIADWSALVALLEGDFYLIAVDLPGHGASCWQEQDSRGSQYFCHRLDQTIQTVAQHNRVDLSRISMLGYSLGGRLASAYAIAFAQRIERLFLEGAHPGLVCEQARQERYHSDLKWANRFAKEPLAQVLRDWYQQPVFADLHEREIQLLIAQRANGDGQLLAEAMMAFTLSKQPDYRRDLLRLRAEAKVPIYFVHGANDHKFAQIGRQLLAESVINSVYPINRCGHNVHRQQPGSLAWLLRVLSGVTRRPTFDIS